MRNARAIAAVPWVVFAGAFAALALEAPESGRDSARAEIVAIASRALRPLFAAPEEGKAWLVEVSFRSRGAEAAGTLAWDGRGRHAIRLDVPGAGAVAAAVEEGRSWLHVARHGVLFSGEAREPARGSPLEDARAWKILKAQVGAALALARVAKLPEGLEIEKAGDGRYRISGEGGKWALEVEGGSPGGPLVLRARGAFEAVLSLPKCVQVDEAEAAGLFAAPEAARREAVEDADLRAMLRTAVDMLSEKALWAVRPELLPPLVPPDLRVDGHPVLVVRGTPEEMGRAYGRALREAIESNLHRVLHGIGLFEAVRSGKWFPAELAATWKTQEKHIPERFVREMDAIAEETGLPRDHVRWMNLFPEHFHCSGVGLRGKATAGGVLLHARILDYMTEVGFQATAVLTVRVPEGHHAWADVGYAGSIGTVTAMNERGLAMGEMGGRGEGHLDGIPMTFLMREVVERFETTEEALAWMRSVPRTCEYFYVLSDAKTRSMAGVASRARSLAAQQGSEELLVLRPGEAHPLLPHGVEDAVLMSAGDRYERLVERVKARYGAITPEVAWSILGEGVAMKSALHIVLFLPETLELWVAQASLDARPAYTQRPSRLDLRDLLRRAEAAARAGS
ncbi:MAG: C45 family autoproteolytic acyltransferase/hydrolase [Planctomycetota bacterium]